MNTKMPLIRHETVYHVGTLDPSAKGGLSFEGAGLSVSLCPADWRSIARLAAPHCFQLDKPDAAFLDAHRFMKRPENRAQMVDWAIEQGYLARGTIYVVSYFDDELEDEVEQCFLDPQEAADEADLCIDEDESDPLSEREGLIPTPALLSRSGWRGRAPLVLAEDFALLAYAEDVIGLDGLWWQDRYSPRRLSAPRGVIFSSRLSEWRSRQLPEGVEQRLVNPYLDDGLAMDP